MVKFIGDILVFVGLVIVWLGTPKNIFYSQFDIFNQFKFAIPFFVGGYFLNWANRSSVQKNDNTSAKDISLAIKKYKFILYLRPFSSTNAYQFNDDNLHFFSFSRWVNFGYEDLEGILCQSLRPTLPFIALGKPDEYGAGKFETVDQTWKNYISELIYKSSLVIMIPSINEGILWELDLILKEGFLGKVIFVMPPSKGLFFATSCEVKSLWEKTRAAFLERGLTIPEYRHSGAFFQCLNGRIYTQKMPTSRNPRKWTSALQNLIDQP